MVDSRSPIEETPMSQQGHSLNEIALTIEAGLQSYLPDTQQVRNAAQKLDNFQMIGQFGIWTTHNIGYTNVPNISMGTGAVGREWGKYIDSLGNQTLLVFSSKGTLWRFNQNALSLSVVPGITGFPDGQPSLGVFAPSVETSQPIAIFCHPKRQPRKILGTTYLTAALAPQIVQVAYTVSGEDSTTSIASQLITAINNNAALQAAGITAKVSTGETYIVNLIAMPGAAIISGISSTTNSSELPAAPPTLQIGPGTETITATGNQSFTVGGSITNGDIVTLTFFLPAAGVGGINRTTLLTQGPTINGSTYFSAQNPGDISLVYNTVDVSGNVDTVDTVATAIQDLINSSAQAAALGLSATVSGAVVTLAWAFGVPAGISLSSTIKNQSGGTGTETITFGGTSAITVGGSITDSDIITLTLEGGSLFPTTQMTVTTYHALLPGGQQTISYTVQVGDTLAAIATGIAAAFAANSSLVALGVAATANAAPSDLTIQGSSTSLAGANGTETVTIAGTTTATIAGTVTANDTVTLDFQTQLLSGALEAVSYAVQSGDTIDIIATNLNTNLNQDEALNAVGITSTVTGGVITLDYSGIVSIAATGNAANPSARPLQFNGKNWPGVFNGKVYSKPAITIPFGDRQVYMGFPDVETQYDVLISSLNSAEQFTQSTPGVATDAVAFTMPPYFGAIKGGSAFRQNPLNSDQILIIGQEDGICMISGSDATSYNLDILTNQYGIVNNRCWATIYDDLVFLTTKGVANLASLFLNAQSPSDLLSKYILDQIQQIDFTNPDFSPFAVHHPLTMEVQFFVPYQNVDNGQNQHCIVLNYNSGAPAGQPPSAVIPIWSTKSQLSAASGFDLYNQMFCADYEGNIQQHYNGDTFAGVWPIFTYQSFSYNVSTQQSARSRNVSVLTYSLIAPKFRVQGLRYAKFGDGSTRPAPCLPNSILVNPANDDGVILGTSEFGQAAFTSQHIRVHNVMQRGRGRQWKQIITSDGSAGSGIDLAGIIATVSPGAFTR